jgi:AbrB family looped-hinge helix DNA binding protein
VKGQVTIPAAIREKLSIRPGDSVSFRLESDGSLVLARVKPLSTLFEEVDQRVPIGDWRRFKADVEEEAAGEKLRKAEKPD